MNNGRIWCVVNPTVGLPLFIGSVAVTSLIVHYCVLSNTNWFSNYWKGAEKATPVAELAPAGKAPVVLKTEDGKAAFAIDVKPVTDSTGGTSFVIKVDRLPGDVAMAAPPAR